MYVFPLAYLIIQIDGLNDVCTLLPCLPAVTFEAILSTQLLITHTSISIIAWIEFILHVYCLPLWVKATLGVAGKA